MEGVHTGPHRFDVSPALNEQFHDLEKTTANGRTQGETASLTVDLVIDLCSVIQEPTNGASPPLAGRDVKCTLGRFVVLGGVDIQAKILCQER